MEMLKNQQSEINFGELLNTFNSIEIQNNTRLANEDLEAMEEMRTKYETFKNTFYEYQKFYNNNSLISFSDSTYSNFQTKKMLAWLNTNSMAECSIYIEKIYSYFRNKYNVKLENNFKKDGDYSSYRDIDIKGEENLKFYLNIDYNNIIDDIFDQLGGFNFEEKAVSEIKNNLKNLCHNQYRNEYNAKLKGKTISLSTYLTWGTDWGKIRTNSYNSNEITHPIFRAISHFEENETSTLNCFDRYIGWRLEGSEFLEFNTFEWLEKFKAVKFFKNGRIDLKFSTAQHALTFAREYCGLLV